MSQEQYIYLKKDGFTLIELLLAVTLSAILMTGIVVFVSSSLGSNMSTKKTLEERNKNEHFEQRLTTVLGNINEVYKTWSTFGGGYLTGIFLSTGGPNPPITFFGLKTQTGYCDSYSGSEGETGTVVRLALRQFTSPETENNLPGYTVSMSENSVFSGAMRIIGTGYPGNDFDTTSGSLTELSSPSALASSGTHLYIADTMNDRIVSYDMVSGAMTKLLGRENGIEKPTSLYFSGSTLLIASTGNGKIFSFQDGDWDGTTFSSHFRVANNFSANIVRFTFPDIPNITSPNGAGNFTFLSGGISFWTPANDIVSTGTWLQYTFSWGLQTFSTGSQYQFNINNLSTAPSGSGNHIVTIDFLSGSTPQYSDTFHYFSKWDNSLESSTGNITKTVASGLVYPHHITGAASWSGTIDWNSVLGNNPPGSEILSSLPVRDLSFGTIGKLLTIRYHIYTTYDCLLGKHTTEERVVKVLLP